MIPSTHLSLFLPLRADANDQAAWRAFHVRYQDVILGWCRRRELSRAWAEDLAQEIWLKLLRDIRTYDPAKGRFRSWLKSVVGNALNDFWRRWQREPDNGGVGGTAFLERVAGLAGPDIAEELSVAIEGRASSIAEEVFARVRARLHETTWQAFYQTLVERRPAKEVAEQLGISVSAVYKNTYRVKQMLHKEYCDVRASDEAPDLSGPGDPSALPQ